MLSKAISISPNLTRSALAKEQCAARRYWTFFALISLFAATIVHAQDSPTVDLSAYSNECGVLVTHQNERISVSWAASKDEFGRLVLNLRAGQPLIEQIGISRTPQGNVDVLLENVDPIVFLTVGTRDVPPGKPADQKWQVFFDKPANRPHETIASKLDLKRVDVMSTGKRATVKVSDLSAGSFHGTLQFTFYSDCRLMHVEAVLSTEQDRRAIIYDAGLLGDEAGWRQFAWLDARGRLQSAPADENVRDRHLAVKHRTIVAETPGGSIACFPPPHQFHYPRDWSNNYQFNWYGRDHHGLAPRMGFGVRQDKASGGAFVPWFNAPPDREHRLGVFYLLSRGTAKEALDETLRFTNGDRFPELPGRLTMTSHWHMAIAVTAMEQRQRGQDPPPIPELVGVFKELGVNMVHLGEFHGDGHPKDPGPLRLPEVDAMFTECRRLSDDELLLIPGEEINTFLGIREEGKHPGHWMSLFPRPVYWTMQEGDTRPFVEDHPKYGKLYHVGDRATMIR